MLKDALLNTGIAIILFSLGIGVILWVQRASREGEFKSFKKVFAGCVALAVVGVILVVVGIFKPGAAIGTALGKMGIAVITSGVLLVFQIFLQVFKEAGERVLWGIIIVTALIGLAFIIGYVFI